MPEVSVIVPVYKAEPYLQQCVDSVLAQTFADFELILVDDGSPDNCGAICDTYAARDGRVRVIHKENRGPSAARNAGLEIARGKYIYFCDSDDYVEKELLADAVQAMDGYDMVVFNRDNVDGDSGCVTAAKKFPELIRVFNHRKETARFLARDYFTHIIGYTVWLRLFRREIIEKNHLRFPEGLSFAEDQGFVACYLIHAAAIRTIPGVYYHHVYRPNSLLAAQKSQYNFDNNNEISKYIYHHILSAPDNEILKRYFSLIHYGIMNHIIARAKENDPALTIPEIRRILLDEVRDKRFFFEQASALLHAKRLLFQVMGTVNFFVILTEWTYYLNGNRTQYRMMSMLARLAQSAGKLGGLMERILRRALKRGGSK